MLNHEVTDADPWLTEELDLDAYLQWVGSVAAPPMHTHDELPLQPVDLAVANHFTSTYPATHFRHMLMLTRHLPGPHVAVTHATVTVRRPGQATEHRPLVDGELADWVDALSVPLSADERTALDARVATLPTLA